MDALLPFIPGSEKGPEKLRSFWAIDGPGELDGLDGYWVEDEETGEEGFLEEVLVEEPYHETNDFFKVLLWRTMWWQRGDACFVMLDVSL